MTENEFMIVLENTSQNGMVDSFDQEDSTFYQYRVRDNPDDPTSVCGVSVALMDDDSVFIMSRIDDIDMIFKKDILTKLMGIYSPFSFVRLGTQNNRLYSFFSCPLEHLEVRIFELAFVEVIEYRTYVLQTCEEV